MAIYRECKTIKFPGSDNVYVITDDTKVAKDQGAVNAGKIFSVGDDGQVELIDQNNIKTELPEGILTYTEQVLTDEQKIQARTNIGAGESQIQSDWSQTNTDSIDYIKNKPNISNDYLILTDSENGFDYVIRIKNGTITMYVKCEKIEVITMPMQTEYLEGQAFNADGMVVMATRQDGSTEEVNNYTYPEFVLTNQFTISYIEDGCTYTTVIDLTVTEFDPTVQLVDFEYTDNEDGTYTLTEWKQTLNGESSTEMIVPDSSLIIL